MASSVWIYFQRVMIPHQQNEAVRDDKPRGNLSDLYPRWLGARELLLHGRDPYSPELTKEIQTGYYGRPLDPSHPHDPKDQQAFAYPLYVVWLLAPIVGIPFWIAQRATLLLLMLLTAFSVLLWLEILNWQLPFDRKFAWIVLTVSCLPVVQGLKLQQLTLLVAGLIAISATAILRGRLIAAGVLLAVATIKPQLVFLLLVWLLIWVSGGWRARCRLFWSFAITMAVLVGASEVLLPGWIREFAVAMRSYYQYTGGGQSLLDVVLTPMGGRVVAVCLIGVWLSVVWKLRRSEAPSSEFIYAISLTLATTLLVIPMFSPYNQVLLLFPVMMLIRGTSGDRPRSTLCRFFVFATEFSILWPFLSAAVLVFALPFLRVLIVEKGVEMPFYSTPAVPTFLLASLLILEKHLILDKPQSAADRLNILPHGAASE